MFYRKKILIADSNGVTQEVFKCILLQAGYEVMVADNGVDACEKVSVWEPDLVLADDDLPGASGFQVCHEIKAMDAPLKIILLMGGHFRSIYKWEVKFDFGADEVLLKPVDPERLLASIESQLSDSFGEPRAAQASSPDVDERDFLILQSGNCPVTSGQETMLPFG